MRTRASRRGKARAAAACLVSFTMVVSWLIMHAGTERAQALRQTYTFEGSGWGHGVGMCQYGARGRAAAGHDYREILAYYYQGTQVSSWPCPQTIRVGLLEGMDSVRLSADAGSFRFYTAEGDIPGGVIAKGETWTVKPGNGGFLVLRPDGSLLNGTSYGGALRPLYLKGSSGKDVLCLPQNGNRRLGHLDAKHPLELNLYGSPPYSLRVLVISDFETYLKGLDEVPGSWPQEAVKAQAVAARSYAVRALGKHASSNFDICDEVHCQYYRGYDKEFDSGWVRAVDATRGEVLTYAGQVAQCFYSSSCGGHTDNNKDVWGGSPVPYLRGVPDPYCMDSVNPYARWKVTYSREEVEARINAYAGSSVGTLYAVDLSDRTPSGRVRMATFTGSAGKKTVTGEQLRFILSLRSAMVNLGAENFDQYVLLANPSGSTARAVVSMTGGSGAREDLEVEIPAFSRRTVHVNNHLDGEEVAVRVEADRGVVAERAMYFNYRGNLDGGSCSPGLGALSTAFYLAEGYTAQAFEAWILLYNPESRPARARLDLLREDGYQKTLPIELPAASRVTVSVDGVEGFSACAFSAAVESDLPLAVERAMYFESDGRRGGHTAEASPSLSNKWYFAEGYTAEKFDTWLLVGNPHTEAAKVRFHLAPPGGKGRVVEAVVPPRSRYTLHADDYLPASELAVFVESDLPVVAERAMYFDYQGKRGGSCAIGSREAAARWFLAEGYTGGDFDTWVLVGNPGTQSARLKISLFTRDGLKRELWEEVPSGARYTLHVDDVLPADEVSVLVEEAEGRGIVVERAMYFDYYGRRGGHASQGLTGTSTTWYFAEGYTGS